MRKTVLLATCAALLLVSGGAAAGGFPANADLHFYAGGSVGKNKLTDYCDASLPSLGATDSENCEDSETAYKLFAGVEFYRYFGLELGYTKFGEVSHSGSYNQSTEAPFEFGQRGEFDAGLSAALVGRLPWNNFAFSAKIGLHKWETTFTGFCRGEAATCDPIALNPAAGIGTQELDGTDVVYGLGAQYNFDNGFALRAEWERYTLDEGQFDDSLDMYSIGALWRF